MTASAADPTLDHDGYTILQGVFSEKEVDNYRRWLDAILMRERGTAVERGWKNDRFQISYVLPAKDPRFLSVLDNDRLLQAVESILGPDCTLGGFNGFTMTERGAQQSLHIDQHMSTPGVAVYLNAVCVLDSFRAENGATRVIPGSHRRTWPPQPSNATDAQLEAVAVEADPGSVILLDAGVWHHGGRNATPAPRRCLHILFGRVWVRPQWDFVQSLPPEVVSQLTKAQRTLLGFDPPVLRLDSSSDGFGRRVSRKYGRKLLVSCWGAVDSAVRRKMDPGRPVGRPLGPPREPDQNVT